MNDSFWTNWDRFLGRSSSRPDSNSESESQPARELSSEEVSVPNGTPASAHFPAPFIHSTLLPAVDYFRVRLPRLHCQVKTMALGPASPTALEEKTRAANDRHPKPHRPLPRVNPPAGLPIRERLLSILQPPINALLGDTRFYLPFEPFPYQYEGIHFLSNSWAAILADEMGLGKTMQTILSLRLLLRSGQIHGALLICPKPLVPNWMREFAMWAEEIPVKPVQGDNLARRNCWLHDRSPVKIANYEALRGDEDLFRETKLDFDVVVLDEAQRIKNRESKTAHVVQSIRRRRSWALTGTPVENQASDVISILEFVHNRPMELEDRPDLLRDQVSGVLLRRTKDMVMDDLPRKLVRDVYIELGQSQRESYDAAEKEGVIRLSGLGEEITIEHVFELIRQLKQICNFDPATGESTKSQQLIADLEEVVASGQKAILFSQYVTTLEELDGRLQEFSPLLYHGKIPHRQREAILDEFRNDSGRPLLMLSYGTGAVGLNLQFTNYVFLFDRWWNPAIEDQAINRAHRVGQKSQVFVSRFITPETIEARIAHVLEKKRELFSFIIDDHESPVAPGLSREDVFGLFDLKVKPKKAG